MCELSSHPTHFFSISWHPTFQFLSGTDQLALTPQVKGSMPQDFPLHSDANRKQQALRIFTLSFWNCDCSQGIHLCSPPPLFFLLDNLRKQLAEPRKILADISQFALKGITEDISEHTKQAMWRAGQSFHVYSWHSALQGPAPTL